MKLLAIIFCLFLVFAFNDESYSQFDLGKTLKKKLEKKAEREANKAIDKGIESTEEAIMNNGEEGAAAVKKLSIQSGIDASRLDSKGYGESILANENSTSEGKANNRRVEFIKL